MKISKNSNNKTGTNKSQGDWNFTKCSKILAKLSFTGCTTKHTDLKWNNLFQTRRKHHELLSLPTATLEKYPHLYGHRVSNRVRYKVKFWKQSKPARYSQANNWLHNWLHFDECWKTSMIQMYVYTSSSNCNFNNNFDKH